MTRIVLDRRLAAAEFGTLFMSGRSIANREIDSTALLSDRLAQLVWAEILSRAVPNVKDRYCFARFVHLIENTVHVRAFTKQQTTYFPFRLGCFPGQRPAAGQLV